MDETQKYIAIYFRNKFLKNFVEQIYYENKNLGFKYNLYDLHISLFCTKDPIKFNDKDIKFLKSLTPSVIRLDMRGIRHVISDDMVYYTINISSNQISNLRRSIKDFYHIKHMYKDYSPHITIGISNIELFKNKKSNYNQIKNNIKDLFEFINKTIMLFDCELIITDLIN